jgi:hypothetical protein
MHKEQLEETLKQLTDGLLMRSETDEPFEFFYFENTENEPLDKETVAHIAGKTTADEIEVVSLEHFFRNMVRLYPEDGEERKQEAARFKQLQQKLKELLQDVQVYRAGNISITVYILGKGENGDFAGLRTLVVET